MKKEIKKLLKERISFYKKDENDSRVDEIMRTILKEFETNFDDYEFDFIFETLTMFGWSPNLIYDDNGRFAVSGDGYSTVVTGSEKIDGNVVIVVEKDDWKKSSRKALKYYIKKSTLTID